MKLHANILSEDERKKIHEDTIRILEEVGIKYSSDKALKILEENGVDVDWEKKTAKVTRKMVEKALETAPKKVLLGARNPEFDYEIPSAYSAYTLDGCGSYIYDMKTNERRLAVRQDNYNALRVFDEMDLGMIAWPPLVATDQASHEIEVWIDTYTATSKHVMNECCVPEEVPYLIEVLRAILGSDEKIKERKIASVIYCTVAPLMHDGEMLDANIELTKYHVPIVPYPMPATGTTGPASLYSNIALANAEMLSALVIFQMATPGCPVVFGDASGSADFNSGAFLEGSPETALQNGAMGEMARFYNLPNTVAGCLSDSKEPGTQAVIEKMITTMPLVLSGADIIQGTGMFEGSMSLSLEQIVVDNEIGHLCKRIRDGVEVSDEKNFFDDIAKVGPGGHFLKAKSTRKAARGNEFCIPKLIDRNSYDSWVKLGSPCMYDKAREIVEDILSKEQRCPLSQEIIEKLNKINERATREL